MPDENRQLQQLRQEGRLEVQGEFVLDPAKAREKLSKYQLEDPHHYVLELVQAAHALGARSISIEQDADEFEMRFDGLELTDEQLEEIFSFAFQRSMDPAQQALRHLAIGLQCAQALNPRHLWFERVRESGSVRLAIEPQGLELGEFEPRKQIKADHYRFYLRERLGAAHLAEYFRVRRGEAAELLALKEYCKFSEIPIRYNGEHLERIAPAEARCLEREEGRIYLTPTTGEHISIMVIQKGVFFALEKKQYPWGADLLVYSNSLRRDLARAKVRQDEHWETLLRSVESCVYENYIERYETLSGAQGDKERARLWDHVLERCRPDVEEEPTEGLLKLLAFLRDQKVFEHLTNPDSGLLSLNEVEEIQAVWHLFFVAKRHYVIDPTRRFPCFRSRLALSEARLAAFLGLELRRADELLEALREQWYWKQAVLEHDTCYPPAWPEAASQLAIKSKSGEGVWSVHNEEYTSELWIHRWGRHIAGSRRKTSARSFARGIRLAINSERPCWLKREEKSPLYLGHLYRLRHGKVVHPDAAPQTSYNNAKREKAEDSHLDLTWVLASLPLFFERWLGEMPPAQRRTHRWRLESALRAWLEGDILKELLGGTSKKLPNLEGRFPEPTRLHQAHEELREGRDGAITMLAQLIDYQDTEGSWHNLSQLLGGVAVTAEDTNAVELELLRQLTERDLPILRVSGRERAFLSWFLGAALVLLDAKRRALPRKSPAQGDRFGQPPSPHLLHEPGFQLSLLSGTLYPKRGLQLRLVHDDLLLASVSLDCAYGCFALELSVSTESVLNRSWDALLSLRACEPTLLKYLRRRIEQLLERPDALSDAEQNELWAHLLYLARCQGGSDEVEALALWARSQPAFAGVGIEPWSCDELFAHLETGAKISLAESVEHGSEVQAGDGVQVLLANDVEQAKDLLVTMLPDLREQIIQLSLATQATADELRQRFGREDSSPANVLFDVERFLGKGQALEHQTLEFDDCRFEAVLRRSPAPERSLQRGHFLWRGIELGLPFEATALPTMDFVLHLPQGSFHVLERELTSSFRQGQLPGLIGKAGDRLMKRWLSAFISDPRDEKRRFEAQRYLLAYSQRAPSLDDDQRTLLRLLETAPLWLDGSGQRWTSEELHQSASPIRYVQGEFKSPPRIAEPILRIQDSAELQRLLMVFDQERCEPQRPAPKQAPQNSKPKPKPGPPLTGASFDLSKRPAPSESEETAEAKHKRARRLDVDEEDKDEGDNVLVHEALKVALALPEDHPLLVHLYNRPDDPWAVQFVRSCVAGERFTIPEQPAGESDA